MKNKKGKLNHVLKFMKPQIIRKIPLFLTCVHLPCHQVGGFAANPEQTADLQGLNPHPCLKFESLSTIKKYMEEDGLLIPSMSTSMVSMSFFFRILVSQ